MMELILNNKKVSLFGMIVETASHWLSDPASLLQRGRIKEKACSHSIRRSLFRREFETGESNFWIIIAQRGELLGRAGHGANPAQIAGRPGNVLPIALTILF